MNEIAEIPQFKNGKRLDRCHRCEHDHAYMKVRVTDGVPLYGHLPCTECECKEFISAEVQAVANTKMTPAQLRDLWTETGYLSPQTPLETRIAAAQIAGLPTFAEQWPEFMKLMLSHTTDTRAALVNSDNKFAHLVAHTEDFIQLAEKSGELKNIVAGLIQSAAKINEQIETALEPVVELMERIDGSISALTVRVVNLEHKPKPWWRRWRRRGPDATEDSSQPDRS